MAKCPMAECSSPGAALPAELVGGAGVDVSAAGVLAGASDCGGGKKGQKGRGKVVVRWCGVRRELALVVTPKQTEIAQGGSKESSGGR